MNTLKLVRIPLSSLVEEEGKQYLTFWPGNTWFVAYFEGEVFTDGEYSHSASKALAIYELPGKEEWAESSKEKT